MHCAYAVHLHTNYTAPYVSQCICTTPTDIINCPYKRNFQFSFFHIKSFHTHTHTRQNPNANVNENTIGNIKLFMFPLMSRLCLISWSLYCSGYVWLNNGERFSNNALEIKHPLVQLHSLTESGILYVYIMSIKSLCEYMCISNGNAKNWLSGTFYLRMLLYVCFRIICIVMAGLSDISGHSMQRKCTYFEHIHFHFTGYLCDSDLSFFDEQMSGVNNLNRPIIWEVGRLCAYMWYYFPGQIITFLFVSSFSVIDAFVQMPSTPNVLYILSTDWHNI